MGILQNEDFKTEAELVGAGGSKTQLLNESKIYVSHAGVAETLDDAIETNKLFTMKELASQTTPNAGYQRIYPKTDGFWYSKDDAGVESPLGSGGGGDFNFLQYKLIGDYNVYDDGAVAVPIDGTGGTASAISVAASPSPIDSTAGVLNLRISKSAVSGLGEGVSVDFSTRGTIDRASIRTAAINISSSANYADGDVGVYLYDVTNSRLIYPADQDVYGSSFVSSQQFSFQLSPDSDSYRLITHCQTTNALAYDLDCVVKVVESKKVTGSIANWPQYNLTVTGTNWTTARAIGIPYKSITGEWRLRFNISGTLSVGAASLTLTVANIVAKNVTNFYQAVTVTGADEARAFMSPNANTIIIVAEATAATNYNVSGDIELDAQPSWAVDYSNQVLSEDVSSRNITTRAYLSSAASHTSIGVYTKVPLNATSYDLAASWDNSNNRFIAQETGHYLVIGQVGVNTLTADKRVTAAIFKNGAAHSYGIILPNSITDAALTSATDIVFLEKNSYVELYAYQNDSASEAYIVGSEYTFMSVYKLASPQQIAASERVYVYAKDNSGQAVTNGNVITFNTVLQNSHNTFASGIFTAPKSGFAKYSLVIRTASVATAAAGNSLGISTIKDGTAFSYTNEDYAYSTTARVYIATTNDSIWLNKDQTLSFKFNENLSAVNLDSGLDGANHLSITME